MKGFLAGLMLGVASGVTALVAAGAHRPGAHEPERRVAGGPAEPESPAPRADQEDLRRAKAQSPGGPAPAASSNSPATRRSLAALLDRIRAVRAGFASPEFYGSADQQRLAAEFAVAVRELMESEGTDFYGACWAPDGMWALTLEVLGGESLGPEQAASLRALLEAAREPWRKVGDALGGRTGLERDAERLRLHKELRAKFFQALDPGQRAAAQELWKALPGGEPHLGGVWYGSSDQLAREVPREWAAELGLNESQQAAVRPIVEEYLREYAAMRAGPQDGDPDLRCAQMMLRAQQRMSETLALTDSQREALRRWSKIYCAMR